MAGGKPISIMLVDKIRKFNKNSSSWVVIIDYLCNKQ